MSMKILEKYGVWVVLIITVGIFLTILQQRLLWESSLAAFTEEAAESDGFRAMNIAPGVISELSKLSADEELSFPALLASCYFDRNWQLAKDSSMSFQKAELVAGLTEKQNRKKQALLVLTNALAAVWEDVRYFPVAASSDDPNATVAFEDSWQSARNYGGERRHEGTDLMAAVNRRGYYPVLSMTDGIVEKIGWLPQGGYRIGVRSPHGGYFYYAHLAAYARDFQEGDAVKAGDLLGLMGDTGYSEIEGTTGNFDVHLHLGIYIRTPNYEELSVNPYWVLKYIEDKKLTYRFSS